MPWLLIICFFDKCLDLNFKLCRNVLGDLRLWM